VTCFKVELASLFQSAIGDFTNFWWSMVVSGSGLISGGRLTNGWNSNLEKQVSAHEFSLETDRHPPDIHLFGDK
jgi:hypothetical protein